MNDFNRNPGAIDDPDMKGGLDPGQERLPPGDTAGDTGGPGEPQPAELDLPGPDDPVAWSYVEPGTSVVGREGVKIGTVERMLGTEAENIFHGIALQPAEGGASRVIPADAVTELTTSEVQVRVSTDEVGRLEEYQAD
ncbi:MAG TPA: hypothetical protein VK838_07130 [Candidatus Limnocylindrales bacterium]|nr:hypothetical protein [Candidatus Limnocylindrales bacterium]